MRILLLSFYYEPDLCAGSFRATALIKALMLTLPKNIQIDVITTLPNRYATFSSDAPELETNDNVNILRIRLPNHKSGMRDQAKAFFHFAKQAHKEAQKQHYDLVIATSSRLMTAALGASIAKQQKTKLYLDIRDIFVDTIKDVLPKSLALLTKPIFSLIEKWTIKKATKINFVSEGFKPYFKARYPSLNCSFFTNGIDDEFIENKAPTQILQTKQKPFVVLYAGNMGEGQGLHAIIPALAQKMQESITFRLIGDGGRKLALQNALKKSGVNNVELLPPMKRDQLIKSYQEADVLFLHLNDYDAFKKVLPSKIFEYAAMGKPIWAGISGYSAEFVKSEISNAAVFHPCNAMEAQKVFAQLSLRDQPRTEFINKFSRTKIMQAMSEDILSVLMERKKL